MSLRLLDLVADVSTGTRGIVIVGPTDLASFVAEATVPVHRNRSAQRNEMLITATDGSSTSLEDLATAVQGCAAESVVIVLLSSAAENAPLEAVADAIVGAGATLIRVATTTYPELPIAVVVRRTETVDAAAAEAVIHEISAALVSPEGGTISAEAPRMDAESRARLDRVRAETARMRIQLREANERAQRAERALARLESSTSMRVGRRLVEAAKSPSSSVTLPRDVYRMWRLRSQRRKGAAPAQPAAVAGTPAGTALRDDTNAATGSQLLNPRLSMAAPLSQLSIVAVTSESTAATLSAYAAVTRVRPHDASQIMAMVDADLVLIDTDAANAPSAWAHLGDPSATDRERSLVDLIDVAHAQGRPVVLVRSGDPSKSASLHALAERCDLVLTSSHGVDAPSWNAGIDLAAAWLPPGDRAGAVFVGQLDARWSAGARESLLSSLRATPDTRIHDWASSVSLYATPWPEDLRNLVGRATSLATISDALDGRAVGIAPISRVARGLLDPITASFLAGAIRVVSAVDPNLDAFAHAVTSSETGRSGDAVREALAAGAPDAASHRSVMRELFLRHATPVMLQRLVDHLGLSSRPLNSRDIAVVTTIADGSTPTSLVSALLAQRIRPAELILLEDRAMSGLDELRAAGISVHHLGADATPEQIGDGVDSPYIVAADPAEILAWPDTHLLDAAIDFEVGFEGVEA